MPNLLSKAYLEGKDPLPLLEKNIERLESNLGSQFLHDAIHTGIDTTSPKGLNLIADKLSSSD